MTDNQSAGAILDLEETRTAHQYFMDNTFAGLCEAGNTPLPDLCKFFLRCWESTPENEKDTVTDALICTVAKYSSCSDADISAFESAMALCHESARRSEIALSEAEEKNLADLCLKAATTSNQSRLLVLLGSLFGKIANYVNERVIELELPFVVLDGIVHFTPPTIIKKPPHLFLTQCGEYPHKDFLWKEKDYDRITHRFETNSLWVKQKFGAQYMQMVAPDKQSVYDDICPTDIPGYDRQIQSVIGAIERAGVPAIYPRQQLKEGRAVRDTYYHTNSHWTDYGAYLAYRATMNRLQQTIPLQVVGPEEFDFVEERAIQDLGGQLIPPYWETNYSIKFRNADVTDTKVSRGDFWTPGAWRIYENRNEKLPVMLVFRDSFFTALAPFFARSFSKVICLRAKIGALSIELLEKFHPDVVLAAHVERQVGLCAWKNRTSFDIYADDFDSSLLRVGEETSAISTGIYDQDIFDIIVAAIRMQFSPNIDIGEETTAFDVDGWDSLAHFTLLLLLEGQVGFTFDDVIKYESRTVGELACHITRARKSGRK